MKWNPKSKGGKKGKAGRKSATTVLELTDFVEHKLAAFATYGEITAAAREEFGISERTVTREIARVRARWSAANEELIEQRRAKIRARLEYAWRRALVEGDFRAIAAIAKVLVDVEGLRAVKKVEISGTLNHRPVAAMSPQEREREIQVLLAKRAAAALTGKTVPADPLPPGTPIDALSEDLDDDEDDDELEPATARAPRRKQRVN